MREDSEYRDQPIERSVVVLGIIASAALYASVALLAMDFIEHTNEDPLHDLVASYSLQNF